MLQELDLPSLQERRWQNRLTFLFKIIEGHLPGIKAEKHLAPILNKRLIRPTRSENQKNLVPQFARNHQRCFHIQHASTPVFKNSFFPRTIREWNNLDSSVVSAGTVGEFFLFFFVCVITPCSWILCHSVALSTKDQDQDTHTCTLTHTHTHMRAHTHTHSHSFTHSQTHTFFFILQGSNSKWMDDKATIHPNYSSEHILLFASVWSGRAVLYSDQLAVSLKTDEYSRDKQILSFFLSLSLCLSHSHTLFLFHSLTHSHTHTHTHTHTEAYILSLSLSHSQTYTLFYIARV